MNILDNLISISMHYVDNYISGSLLFTYKNQTIMGSINNILSYIGYSSSGLSFLNEGNFVLYNGLCIGTVQSHTNTIDMIVSSIYGCNITSNYVVHSYNNVYRIIPTFIICDLLFSMYTCIIIFITLVLLHKESLFKPLISVFNRIIVESEQNIFNMEDFLLLLSAYCVYILYFGSIYVPMSGIVPFLFKFNKLLMALILVAVVSTPIYFLWKSGCMSFIFIKGYSNDNNLYVTSMNDTMGLLSTFIRYVVQAIRWVLFFLIYFILQLFLHEIKYNLLSFDTFSGFYTSSFYIFSGFSSNIFIYFIYVLARVWFEIMDFLFIMIVQLSAFIVVLFWLLGFLFSSTIPSIFELVYSEYRKSPNILN